MARPEYGYRAVKEHIQQRIVGGTWRAGDRLPTLTEASRLYGVNYHTVQRAIGELQREGFVDARGRHGCFASDRWTRQTPAPQPIGHPGGLGGLRVGMMVHWDAANPGLAAQNLVVLERLLTSRLCQEGGTYSRLMIEPHATDATIDGDRVAGEFKGQVLVVTGSPAPRLPRLVQRLSERGVRLLGCSGSIGQSFTFDGVRIDDVWAMHHAVAHLHELGHRRIAFAGLPADLLEGRGWHETRRDAFADAMREHDLVPELWPDTLTLAEIDQAIPELRPDQRTADNRHQPASGWVQGQRYTPGQATAVVCANDNVAEGFITAVRKRGLRVPEDVSVIGYDNTPNELVQHELTTFTVPDQRVADSLLGLIEFREGLPRGIVGVV